MRDVLCLYFWLTAHWIGTRKCSNTAVCVSSWQSVFISLFTYKLSMKLMWILTRDAFKVFIWGWKQWKKQPPPHRPRPIKKKKNSYMIIRISSVVSPSFVLGQFSSVLVMHHRFLPISTGRCCLAAGGAWCWAGRKKCVCGHGGQPADSSHQPDPIRDIRTRLPASGCSHLPPPHPAIYLSLPSARTPLLSLSF